MARIKVCRRETFCAAHQLVNRHWSAEKNKAVFGKCYHPNYHGHNYVLEAWLEGEINPETGYLYDLKSLKNLIKEEVLQPFDHKNFNLDIPEFKTLNPTAENIAIVIYQKLRCKIDRSINIRIRLYETLKNSVEFGDF
jgi:6-pyruvoyltetrahydropterin/6-carboxytetrahydropterin synthase